MSFFTLKTGQNSLRLSKIMLAPTILQFIVFKRLKRFSKFLKRLVK